jgi:hypothetical protein
MSGLKRNSRKGDSRLFRRSSTSFDKSADIAVLDVARSTLPEKHKKAEGTGKRG